MSLGRIIRQRREEMKLTLDEVSRRIGYSKPYLSTIETDRVKNPPADELLARLEQLLEFEQGFLVQIAHFEGLPADVREAFETSKAENDQWRALIRQIVEQGGNIEEFRQHEKVRGILEQSDNTEGLPQAGRLVPIINNVAAGYPMDYDDKGYPPGGADDYVRCPDLHDPHAFAVRVVGNSMEPKYRQGDIIIFSPAAQVSSGDDCFVRLSDPHETTFKQAFFEPTGEIRLQPRNHQYPPISLPSERINGLWKAVIRYEKLNDKE